LDKYKKNKTTNRITFESITPAIKQPNLLNIQVESFEEFVQRDVARDKRENRGLQEVFTNNIRLC
jgi:DNA-directed RNA polymerase subunit beta